MKFKDIIQGLTKIAVDIFHKPGDLLTNVIGEFVADPLEKLSATIFKKIGESKDLAKARKQLDKLTDRQVEDFLQQLQGEVAAGLPADKKEALTLGVKADSKDFAKELLREIVRSIGGKREIEEFFGRFQAFKKADAALKEMCVSVFFEVKQYYLGRQLRPDDRVTVNTIVCYADKRFDSINGVLLSQAGQLQGIYGMLSQLLNQSGGKAGGVSVEQIGKDDDRLRWRLRKCRSCGYDGEQFSYDDTGKLVICGACGAVYEAIQDVDGYETAVGPRLDRMRDEMLSQIKEWAKTAGAQGLEILGRMDEFSEKMDGLVKKLATKEYLYSSDDSIGADFVGRMKGELSALEDSLKKSKDLATEIDKKNSRLSEQIRNFDLNRSLALKAKAEAEEKVKGLEREADELEKQLQKLVDSGKVRGKGNSSKRIQGLNEKLKEKRGELEREKGRCKCIEDAMLRMQADDRREEEEWHRQQPCEFFFEYSVRLGEHSRGLGEEQLAQYAPRLYVERDVIEGKGYILFAVFDPWNRYAGQFTDKAPDLSGALFDRAEVVYKRGGAWAEDLEGKTERSVVHLAKGVRGKTANINYYVDNDFREIIANTQNDGDLSGCGKVRFTKTGSNSFVEYLFFINFAFRVRIPYRIVKPKGKRAAHVRVWSPIKENEERDLSIGLFRRREFLHAAPPVGQEGQLKNGDGAIGRPFSVTEAEKGVLGKKIRLRADVSAQADEKKGGRFSVGFLAEPEKRYCLLEDQTPEYARIAAEEKAPGEAPPAAGKTAKEKLGAVTAQKFVCPYCHELISLRDAAAVAQYRSGGVACNGTRLSAGAVKEKGGAPVSDRLYCKKDLTKNGEKAVFGAGWNRLLPAEYLKRINYRIAVIGRKQSGKTVFLSRLLGIDVGGGANCLPLRSSCGKLFSAEACPIDAVDVSTNALSGRWERATSSVGGLLYKELGIDVPSGKFPQTTQQNPQLQRCPLFVDVRGRATGMESYIALYDIAGEDVERGEHMDFITAPETLGCFLIIDGDLNKTIENFKVADELSKKLAADKSPAAKEVPLAVILTKFDEHEQYFSPDAHCLRGDIPDMIPENGRYAGSALERNIDMAGAEIYSYLKSHPKMTDVDECVRNFKNVKFFGVSSLGFADAVKPRDEADTSVKRMRFMTSPKRIELPFVWMMKQFGIIE